MNMTGGEALARRLDEIGANLPSSARDFHARVSFLTKTGAGQQAMMDAGIDLNNRHTRATVLKWLGDTEATTSAKYRRAVDQAYAARKRVTLAASLKRRLGNQGRGTRVEVYPVDQTNVAPGRRRDLEIRRINIRPHRWDDIVDTWARGGDLDDIWEAIAEDQIGSDWGAYVNVSHIGF